MFFKKKSKLEKVFKKIADTIEENPVLKENLKEEMSLEYYSHLLEWFYSSNRIAFLTSHLTIFSELPDSERLKLAKDKLEGEKKGQIINLTKSLNRIIEMKGDSFKDTEILLNECKRMFFN